MLFRSVYLKTLRDFRVPILGWGLGTGLLMYAVLTAVPALLTTEKARQELVSLAGQFCY